MVKIVSRMDKGKSGALGGLVHHIDLSGKNSMEEHTMHLLEAANER